jgi:hypothetical protein
MSQNVQIYSNTLDGNFGGIEYFLNCDVLSGRRSQEQCGARQHGRRRHAELPVRERLQRTSSCTSTQVAPYLNGSKNLTFSRNAYRVPSLSNTRYFLWGGLKGWTEWQALGQDAAAAYPSNC